MNNFINKNICGDTRIPRLPSQGYVVPPAVTPVDIPQTGNLFGSIQSFCGDDVERHKKPEKGVTSFNYGQPLSGFMDEVRNELSRLPECQAGGAHSPADHCGHGLHSQINLDLGDRIVKFRRLYEE